MTDYRIASDGLPARVVERWAEEKLHYVDGYIDIFTTGMKDLWARLVYIDLFSGPGLSIIEGTSTEIPGSPTLALQSRYGFARCYLNDLDQSAFDALRARFGSDERAIIRHLDCNDAALDAIEAVELDRPRTLSLAVIDPTGFQIEFDSIANLTRGRPIDLIITVMTGHLRRFIGTASMERRLDRFFGSVDWRSLVDIRESGGRVTYRQLLDAYEDGLRAIGYSHVDDDVRILNKHEGVIYHLVFASKHPRGADFFRKISRRRFRGQYRLPM